MDGGAAAHRQGTGTSAAQRLAAGGAAMVTQRSRATHDGPRAHRHRAGQWPHRLFTGGLEPSAVSRAGDSSRHTLGRFEDLDTDGFAIGHSEANVPMMHNVGKPPEKMPKQTKPPRG